MGERKQPRKSIYLLGKGARFISLSLIGPLAKISITPNQITVASLLVCVFSALLYTVGTARYNLVAVVLFWVFIVCDHMDGDLARHRGLESVAGEFIDSLVGKLAFVLVYAGICVGLAKTYDAVTVWATGFIVLGGFFAVQSMMFKRQLLESKQSNGTSTAKPSEVRRVSFLRTLIREFTAVYIGICYLIIIGSLTNKLYYTLLLSAFYLWLMYFYEVIKTIRRLNALTPAGN